MTLKAATLRTALRVGTKDAHDALDARLGDLPLSTTADYTTFLRIQYEARAPIERWCERHLNDAVPPAQTPLIADDLAELGAQAPATRGRFRLPAGADPDGLRWALAGSVMGNRAMLVQMRKRGLSHLPDRFLSDEAMLAFWKELRPGLERPVEPNRAASCVAAAEAVFERFALAADALLLERAA